MKKYKDQITLLMEINQVLRDDWNPIGFSDVLPQDEYLNYAMEILKYLNQKASKEFITYYLEHICNNIIGLNCSFERHQKSAEKIIELKKI